MNGVSSEYHNPDFPLMIMRDGGQELQEKARDEKLIMTPKGDLFLLSQLVSVLCDVRCWGLVPPRCCSAEMTVGLRHSGSKTSFSLLISFALSRTRNPRRLP